MFRVTFKPLNGIRAGWPSLKATGADLLDSGREQFFCNTLTAQGCVYKGMINDCKPVTRSWKGNFGKHFSG